MFYLSRHRIVLAFGGVFSALVLSCCAPPPHRRPPTTTKLKATTKPKTATRPKATTEPKTATQSKATTKSTLIHASGVGNLHVGRAIPAAYLRPAAKPEQHYTLGFHADAQNYEGFRFSKGSVLVVMNRGLFRAWFDNPQRKGGPLPNPATRATFARAAVKAARGGGVISWIVIQRPGPRTQKKIGVGSTLADLTRAYGTLKLLTTPPDFGRDECSALITPLKNVRAFFRTCRDAKAGGKITRMSIWISRN